MLLSCQRRPTCAASSREPGRSGRLSGAFARMGLPELRQCPTDLTDECRIRVLKRLPLGPKLFPDLPKWLAGDVVAPPALAASVQEPELGRVYEISSCGAFVELGELHVRRPRHPEPEEGVEESGADPVVQPVFADELIDSAPLCLGLIESAAHRLCLHVVRSQIDLHPEGRVVVGGPS